MLKCFAKKCGFLNPALWHQQCLFKCPTKSVAWSENECVIGSTCSKVFPLGQGGTDAEVKSKVFKLSQKGSGSSASPGQSASGVVRCRFCCTPQAGAQLGC